MMLHRWIQLRILFAAAVLLLAAQSVTSAAAGAGELTGIRFGRNAEYDRIVLDLSVMPKYTVTTENGDQRILVTLPNVKNQAAVTAFKSDVVRRLSIVPAAGGVALQIDLTAKTPYRVTTFVNPPRIAIDVQTSYEDVQESTPAAGMRQIKYVKKDAKGFLTAYFIIANRNAFKPETVLANGVVPGRAPVSQMARSVGAAAAVNSVYFAPNGDIIGMLKIDDKMAGTTYFRRSAVGFYPDGETYFDFITYGGKLTMGGITCDVAGIDIERSADNLIIYNTHYGASTKTNEYGMEYTVRGGKVVSIQTNNSRIPADGYVVSVHGKRKDDYKDVKVGDSAVLYETLGDFWDGIPNIVGAGPTLVRAGEVQVTAGEEQFPADIARGRAPRTAFGVTESGDYILAVADGRQSHSIGCTLQEMGALMKKFGAVDAINFDGGGSSELVVKNAIVNRPSDGHERSVSAALALVAR
ncbi:hypothetical protein TAMA11512_06680 [Selenomonas sp. TAMA-11512]|uniref:phosphodiester glycosidase family protein n=1 Tax=Selenomonas sp. TAMA-11512 TaxID=3095337 RepID=UPI00308A7A2A|nr:hypothetical protein TAMA11512_06680 [Selenomonas sp. TAMA-11512]